MSDATGTVRGVVVFCDSPVMDGTSYTDIGVRVDGVYEPDEATPVAIVPLTPEAHAARVEAVAKVLMVRPFWVDMATNMTARAFANAIDDDARAVLAALGLDDRDEARANKCRHGFTVGACELGFPSCACADEMDWDQQPTDDSEILE